MNFTLPKDHKPGMRVPKGGSSCRSCEYLGTDGATCSNKYFQAWNGSDKLPAPADEYCSDWYEPGEHAMPLVILVRHGETPLNRSANKGESAEKIRGWLDVPLDANGIKQAHDTARTLTREYKFDEVIASPLKRALVTAQAIATVARAPIETNPALKPWNVGRWAGQPVARVAPMMATLVEHPQQPAPGGESFGAFAERFLDALVDILARAKEKNADICVVTHTRNLQLTKAWVTAGAKADLTYDPKSVNDYSNEVSTGDWLTLRAA